MSRLTDMSKKKSVETLDLQLEMTFAQDNDCAEVSDNGQFLKIKTQNGGGGDFYILSTERWAFEKPEEVLELIQQFIDKHNKVRIDK